MEPGRNVPLREVLRHFEERIYKGPEEIEMEAKRIWNKTCFPEWNEYDCRPERL